MSIRNTITKAYVEFLQGEAESAGDTAQYDLCTRALDGDDDALVRCLMARAGGRVVAVKGAEELTFKRAPSVDVEAIFARALAPDDAAMEAAIDAARPYVDLTGLEHYVASCVMHGVTLAEVVIAPPCFSPAEIAEARSATVQP